MVFKTLKLDEITKEMTIEMSRSEYKSTPKFRSYGNKEEPAKETEKESTIK